MASKKEAQELVREAERQGWRVEDRGDSWFCKSPDMTTMVTVHKTPSDVRAWKNSIARMRRGGLIWPAPKKKTQPKPETPEVEDEDQGEKKEE